MTDGRYEETFDLVGRSLTLRAAPGATVRLDCTGAAWTALHVRAGSLAPQGIEVDAAGTAVHAKDAELTLERCTLTAGGGPRSACGAATASPSAAARSAVPNRAWWWKALPAGWKTAKSVTSPGDGLVIGLGADPAVAGCTIAGCGYRGIYIYHYARPVIEGCDVSRTNGPGIAVAHRSVPTIRRTAVHDVTGAGISFGGDCTGLVEACRLENTEEPSIELAEGAAPSVIESASGIAAKGLDGLLTQLDGMVGLRGVKAEVRAVVDEIQVDEWRRNAGLAVGAVSHHLIFTGAPGTGKTTVARTYGSLLAELGVLTGGQFREVSRRDLVGQYIGHIAEKTSVVFEECLGGVLFIDEGTGTGSPPAEPDTRSAATRPTTL
ncbi:ATPase family protein associated with various cellular activities (AAA) [Amycolatopsis sulphurea]|uniref:ATPase family protein associated with various cellular activities (AAA) n=1 Tax=Amycolatopsis sulphurea TaxID=76022 RepID=A0A2A9FDV4_9PSEU|nr:right-handed parallel beta-helix repeat-containing protein [Amycolatopsis sulphurea]PFG49338.1 ATPase family protein associated with various cellular activities (AAA) [Amycolatopsis sulphurea]